MPDTELTVTLPSGDVVAYSQYGDPAGKPVLYLHGAASSRLEAGYFDAAAGARGLQLLAPDRPGCGGSSPVPLHDAAAYGAQIGDFLATLGVERVVASGLSNGGMFALAAAAVIPEHVVGVVAVNSATPVADPAARSALSTSARIAYRFVQLAPGPIASVTARNAKKPSPPRGPDKHLLTDESVVVRHRASMDQLRRQGGGIPYLREEMRLAGAAWGFDHRRVPVPVVLVSGERDAGIGYARRWAGELPQGRLRTFPGGHLGFLEPRVRDQVMASCAELSPA